MRAVWISTAVLVLTTVIQAIVVVLSGSVALLGDALHNATDALTAIPMAVAFTVGRRAATRRYTHGFGRAEDLAGLVIVVLIALSAAVAGYEAIRRLTSPQDVHYLAAVAAAGLVGFAGNELVARHRIHVGRRIGSAALVADGLHARTDGFTSLAVVLGTIGVALGFPMADPIAGLLITIAILVVLKDAARMVYLRIMDAVDPALTDTAERTLLGVPGVMAVRPLRVHWIGHELQVEAGLRLSPELTMEQTQRVCGAARLALTEALPHASPSSVLLDLNLNVD